MTWPLDSTDINVLGKLSDNLMLSGGAKGADAYWSEHATNAGHQVIHWSFEGHKSYAPEHQTIKLDLETLKEADIRLEMANTSLHRRIPYNKPWVVNLLRRNWYQVKYAETVYAVGTFDEHAMVWGPEFTTYLDAIKEKRKNNKIKDTLCVSGGTAWALQMHIDLCVEKGIYNRILFYDQKNARLFKFDQIRKIWVQVIYSYPSSPPRPTGIYAAIGTRDLNENGKAFIEDAFSKS